MDLATVYPILGLEIACGPVTLRGVRDDDIPALVELALAGIHRPGSMPFAHPWTQAPPAELGPNVARHHWRLRAQTSPAAWEFELGAWRDGRLVGLQGLYATDFGLTRAAETGSWLGLQHQGRGTGTLMRQAMCVFAVDVLGAEEIVSPVFADNPASIAVSRKVGYRHAGTFRKPRGTGYADSHRLVLTAADLVRPAEPVTITGGDAVRDLLLGGE